jgi:hypothetical protein
MRRRLVDRVMSLVHPQYRFHCGSFGCGWAGNLPVPANARSTRIPSGRGAALD